MSIVTKLRALRAHEIRVETIPRDPSEDSRLVVPAVMLESGPASGDTEETPGSFDTLLKAKIDEQAYRQASYLIRSGGGLMQTD